MYLFLLTLFLPGEGVISPLIVCHVTKSVRNRVKFAWKPAFKGLSKKNCFLLKGWNGLSWQDQTLYWTKQTFFFLSCTKRLSFIQDLVSTFFPHFCAKFKIAKILYVDCRIIHHSPVQATVSFAIHFFLKIFSREKCFEIWQNWLLFKVRVSKNAKSLTLSFHLDLTF